MSRVKRWALACIALAGFGVGGCVWDGDGGPCPSAPDPVLVGHYVSTLTSAGGGPVVVPGGAGFDADGPVTLTVDEAEQMLTVDYESDGHQIRHRFKLGAPTNIYQ